MPDIDAWAAGLRAIAGPRAPEPVARTLQWQIVDAVESSRGRRLLIVELDDQTDRQVAEALDVLGVRVS